ncbi:MAG: single-stranded-DNA-specific exonuclease RecJ [Candidatus Auribacterota bacterium]|jgi:single-stranded-DNA-specific exonuclease|nr:single-stranded-DNA-specific exonuclease RecJ [Candidatus Auribacterota bacterium]
MRKRWILYPVRETLRDQISRRFELSRFSAQILINRGLDSVEEVDKFLNISLRDLYDPFLLDGMEEAVDRILFAVERQETVLIHGDYDVDGVTSTALLYDVLYQLDMPVHFYIPNRLIEGYGLGVEGVECASRIGASLMVTVDCGINAIDSINELNKRNIDVVITDHHMPSDELPKAQAIVNPNLVDSTYPFKDLAGVGVCFKLMHALLKRARDKKIRAFNHLNLQDHLDLVALGTIADMMPLVDENRIFVHYGLKRLSQSSKVGLCKLMEKAGIPSNTKLKTTHVSFLIAPRINSIGRLKDAEIVVELLHTKNASSAEKLADLMEENNKHRQLLEEEVFRDARDMIENNPVLRNEKILVVAKENWAVGVVSIVAARLTREYYKPAIVLSLEDGIGRGSARSINGFNLLDGLKKCQDMLMEFGGHSYAAGLSIKSELLPAFIKKLNSIADGSISSDDLLPELYIDFKLSLSEIGDELMKEIEIMAPFGQKNSRPMFLSQGLTVQGFPRFFGKNHVKFIVEDENGIIQEVIGFNMQKQLNSLTKGDKIDIVYSLNMTDYTGFQTIQLQLVDARILK